MRLGIFVCRHLSHPAGAAILAATLMLGVSAADAAPLCKPVLAFADVRFSEVVHPEVDASRCATASDASRSCTWKPGAVEVSVDFWADEAVEGYRLTSIAACPCRD